jgi:hypothetical protein
VRGQLRRQLGTGAAQAIHQTLSGSVPEGRERQKLTAGEYLSPSIHQLGQLSNIIHYNARNRQFLNYYRGVDFRLMIPYS